MDDLQASVVLAEGLLSLLNYLLVGRVKTSKITQEEAIKQQLIHYLLTGRKTHTELAAYESPESFVG